MGLSAPLKLWRGVDPCPHGGGGVRPRTPPPAEDGPLRIVVVTIEPLIMVIPRAALAERWRWMFGTRGADERLAANGLFGEDGLTMQMVDQGLYGQASRHSGAA